MSQENLETVRRLFEAVEQRDLPGVLAAYDAEIVIREADSLPYGGEYRGHAGAANHGRGYVAAWGKLQTAAEQKMDAEFLDAGDYIVVIWRQRAAKKSGEKFDAPAVSLYKMRDGKIIESQMFHADTAAILQFIASKK